MFEWLANSWELLCVGGGAVGGWELLKAAIRKKRTGYWAHPKRTERELQAIVDGAEENR